MGIVTDVRGTKFIGAQSSTGVKETSFAPGTYWGKRPYTILSLIPQ
jgi:lipoprotein Spr